MLLSFRVANYRSLRDEHELSFVATEFYEGNARLTGVRSEGRDVGVVPSIGIFGANASGKSNVLAAMLAMREAVRTSVTAWAEQEGVPREPFALDPSCRDETTLLEVNIVIGRSATRYTYGFELSDERVEAEWLHAYPNGRRQVWFDREAGRADEDGGEYRFPGERLKGPLRPLTEFTRDNALFLTAASTLNHPQLGAIHRWFIDNFRAVTPGDDVAKRSAYTRDMLLDATNGPRYVEQAERLLRAADLGVARLDVDAERPKDQRVRLLHSSSGRKPVPLDFARQESLGTHAWFAFIGPLLQVLDEGSVLLADELDASLHPLLAAEVIRLFADPDANPHGAQLIFTTHDATLLGSTMLDRPLDRDQVWITTKRKSGQTELYPLIDARPRKTENLERGYLQGRYGGIPKLSTGELARDVSDLIAEPA